MIYLIDKGYIIYIPGLVRSVAAIRSAANACFIRLPFSAFLPCLLTGYYSKVSPNNMFSFTDAPR